MTFVVLPTGHRPPTNSRETFFLVRDDWNDYWKFETLFYLIYVDPNGAGTDVGQVKIGQFSMAEDQKRPGIEDRFDGLDERFFSLGQDESYYSALAELGADVMSRALHGLHDLAVVDDDVYERALGEDVTGTSLLRQVSRVTVERQFRRMAQGGARVTAYNFDFSLPAPEDGESSPPKLTFRVEPDSHPPTNIHVLIGRNGVGKTRLLTHMTQALADEAAGADIGRFTTELQREEPLFAGLVTVAFSAFDSFEPLPGSQNKSTGLRYTYIGLKRLRTKDDGDGPVPLKSLTTLATDFGLSLSACLQGARQDRWRRALEMLESDPIFADAEVATLAALDDEDELKKQARDLFRSLSSGHKIVLLTVTRLVASVEERSLVLLDEPEAHLHPPLLSAFVRSLSDLVINRNAVAIIASHSPVVLQEVPRSCAWIMRRAGNAVRVDRPEIETFGENMGVLTREVFGLEVTRSGFHRMLADRIIPGGTYGDVLASFGGELGAEARGLVRAMLAGQSRADDHGVSDR